ncbi:hypothetical protein [Metabacillus sp. 84]|uniref:hypothetical protein n=2 Tax=unclassified Metabacillus TaxID=2675274 RepID=UPI003CEC0F4C
MPQEVIDKNMIHPKIKHLNDKQIQKLIERYYKEERIQSLIDEYKIDIRPNGLVTLFPPIISEKVCPYCMSHLVEKRRSRSTTRSQECLECGHYEGQATCMCDNCFQMRKKEIENEKCIKCEKIKVAYDPEKFKAITEESLTKKQRLYLASVLRAAVSEDFGYINPLNEFAEVISPTPTLAIEMVTELLDYHIIIPYSGSTLTAYKESNLLPNIYNAFSVYYLLNVESPKEKEHLIHCLLNPEPAIFIEDQEFRYVTWKRIAREECMQYLIHSLKKVGFEFNPGKKTIAVVNGLLDYFSTSQIFGIIFRSMANGTKLYQEKKIEKENAANFVINQCQTYGERAIAEGWDLTRYRRDFDLPQTKISEIFYDRLLQIGSLGFDQVPTKDI